MTDERSHDILYVSYTGLLEPLGQSQVYRYLQRLAEDHDITLITFEKPADMQATDRFERMKETVAEEGIEWYPLQYHDTPSLPGTMWDLTIGFIYCVRTIRRDDIDVIHTRSYVPSVLGLLCKQIFGTKFVFDMRGFWADERVDGGIWEEDELIYRVAKWFEAKFFTHADIIISLTESGIDAIQAFDHIDTQQTHFEMIPTCVDLDLFTPEPEKREEEFVLGYVGSAGTWHLFDDVLECFELLQEQEPNSRLLILNQGDHDYITDRLNAFDIDQKDVELKAVGHTAVPDEMNRMDAGIFFYTPTFSKKGTSPTKMGEFLACGLPCLSNASVGDVESILENNDVGVALKSFDTEAKKQAVNRLVELSSDSATADRCRQVAESYYSLEKGVRKYDEIYRDIADNE